MVNSHLELGQLWRCPVEWCAVWKGSVRDCLGHLNDKHGGSTFFVLSSMDGGPGHMADGPSYGCFGHCGRRMSVPSIMPDIDWCIGTVCIRTRRSGGGGGGASSCAVIRGSSYGHHPAYTAPHFHPCIGAAAGPGTSRMFSGWRIVTETDESTSCVIFQ